MGEVRFPVKEDRACLSPIPLLVEYKIDIMTPRGNLDKMVTRPAKHGALRGGLFVLCFSMPLQVSQDFDFIGFSRELPAKGNSWFRHPGHSLWP